MKRNLRAVTFTLFFMLSNVSGAVQIAGVGIPDEVRVADQVLYLNGAGIRYKFIFKIYVAALYLPKRTHEPTEALALKGPARVSMHFLYSKVAKRKLVDAWNEGFRANNDKRVMDAIAGRLADFNEMFDTVREGDQVLLDYLPGEGTRVTIAGRIKGIVPGMDFYRALLRVWLGPEPVKESLKKALLGN